MNLTWTELVWVLKRKSGFFSIKNVSCISLAGWCSGKFNALKLCQSSSISGPSLIVNPIFEKMSTILFFTIDMGWRDPNSIGSPVLEISLIVVFVEPGEIWFFKSSNLDCAVFFNWFKSCPTFFFLSLSNDLNSTKYELSNPFLPKYLILKSSISTLEVELKSMISFMSCLILSSIIN